MANQVMRITLKAYDHKLIDQSAEKIIDKYKDSREQFEQRTHKRLIDVIAPTQKTMEALSKLDMPAGVYVNIKMKEQ